MNPISFLFKSSSLVTRTVAQLAVVGTVGAMSVGVMSSSAFTSLNAVASNTAVATGTGTLQLTEAANGVGFGSPIANMAPGDRVNRYVDFTNGVAGDNSPSLPGLGLSLKAADGSSTLLSTNATYGLQVAVSSCAGSFAPLTGACTGGAGTIAIAETPLTTFIAGATALGTPVSIPAGTTEHLMFSISLPDQNETSTNGGTAVPVAAPSSIQGLTASLTFTLTEVQAVAATTNS